MATTPPSVMLLHERSSFFTVVLLDKTNVIKWTASSLIPLLDTKTASDENYDCYHAGVKKVIVDLVGSSDEMQVCIFDIVQSTIISM